MAKKKEVKAQPNQIELMTSENLAILLGQQYQRLIQDKDNIVAITQELEKRQQRQSNVEKELNDDVTRQ